MTPLFPMSFALQHVLQIEPKPFISNINSHCLLWLLSHGTYKIRVGGVPLLPERFALSYGHRLITPFTNADGGPPGGLNRRI